MRSPPGSLSQSADFVLWSVVATTSALAFHCLPQECIRTTAASCPEKARRDAAIAALFVLSRFGLLGENRRKPRKRRAILRVRRYSVGRWAETRTIWRRERDSNPRYGFPYTHFPGVRLQPLGHPSTQRPFASARWAWARSFSRSRPDVGRRQVRRSGSCIVKAREKASRSLAGPGQNRAKRDRGPRACKPAGSCRPDTGWS